MKHITALILIAVILAGFGIPASSELSPEVRDWITIASPITCSPPHTYVDWSHILYFDYETDVFQQYVSCDDSSVKIIAAEDAEEQLSGEELEAFMKQYSTAKAVSEAGTGKQLRKAYWYCVPEEYFEDGKNYAKFQFSCSGTGVEVIMDGEPVEVVHYTKGDTYYAKITSNGTLLIYSNPD